MKKSMVLLACLLLVAGTGVAGDIGLFGAVWDQSAPGTVWGAGLRLTGREGPWLADLTATYLPDSDVHLGELTAVPDATVQVTPLEIGLRYLPERYGRLQPYLGGGAGYYLVDSTLGTADNEWGWYGVGGLDLGARAGWNLFVEAVYRDVTSHVRIPDPVAGDLRPELDLGGWGVNIGVVIHL